MLANYRKKASFITNTTISYQNITDTWTRIQITIQQYNKKEPLKTWKRIKLRNQELTVLQRHGIQRIPIWWFQLKPLSCVGSWLNLRYPCGETTLSWDKNEPTDELLCFMLEWRRTRTQMRSHAVKLLMNQSEVGIKAWTVYDNVRYDKNWIMLKICVRYLCA